MNELDLEPPRCEETPVEERTRALASVFVKLQSGYDISRKEINRAKREGRYDQVEGLGYGEVDVEAFGTYIRCLPLVKEHGVFVDMGSGSGKAVLAAAFSGRFSQSVGVEILEPLHRLAQEAQGRAVEIDGQSASIAQFELGDIFSKEDLWKAADVLLVTCTLFTDDMMQRLENMVARLIRPGTIVITTTRPLNNPRARKLSEGRIKYAKGSLLFIVYLMH